MNKQLTAQEIYNEFYFESCKRARSKGDPLPNEVEVFKLLVKASRNAIIDGDAPPDFLEQLSEVKPHIAIERESQSRLEAREKGLREGTLLDLDDLL